MRPDISVVIPTYNREKSIYKTIDSLLNQTYKNFEVIIVDDGSEDETASVVREICNNDSRIRYVYQPNAGVSAARNKGLNLSIGDYVCFLDSDDFYESIFLEKMYESIREQDCDICYCGYNLVYQDKLQKKKTKFKNGNVLRDYILGIIRIHTTGWIINKEFLLRNNIKFTEGVSWGEDIEFFTEILSLTNKVCFVNDHLTNYNIAEEEGKLSSFNIDKIDKDFELIERLLTKKGITDNNEIKRILVNYRLPALITYKLLKAYKSETDLQLAKSYFKKYRSVVYKFPLGYGVRGLKLNIAKAKLIYINFQ